MAAAAGFGWAEVAGIAGLVVAVLVGALGSLFIVLIRRLFKADEEAKENLGAVMLELRNEIKESNRERRQDVKELRADIENMRDSLLNGVTGHCSDMRSHCMAYVNSQISGVADQATACCRKVEELKRQRERDWDTHFKMEHKEASRSIAG